MTLVAIHLIGIHITGISVNPARSFGPAVFVGGQAIAQLWVFLLAPSSGRSGCGHALPLQDSGSGLRSGQSATNSAKNSGEQPIDWQLPGFCFMVEPADSSATESPASSSAM